jgi:hypothetical protein
MFSTSKIIKRALLSIAVIAALSAPATASARIIDRPAAPVVAQESSSPVIRTYSSPASGFQWGDAAIGAAGVLGLLGIAGLSSQHLRRRRRTFAS